ncbi:MAG: hypothetical protein WKH64_16925, partial [Chloroflexia bacterium]
AETLDRAIRLYESQPRLNVQDRLVLVRVYTYRAQYYRENLKFDQADALLKKAVALRDGLDKDKSALSDPSTLRQFHYSFGQAYFELLNLAVMRKDGDARILWSRRVQDEAASLLKAPDPTSQSRASALWTQYRASLCADDQDAAARRTPQRTTCSTRRRTTFGCGAGTSHNVAAGQRRGWPEHRAAFASRRLARPQSGEPSRASVAAADRSSACCSTTPPPPLQVRDRVWRWTPRT